MSETPTPAIAPPVSLSPANHKGVRVKQTGDAEHLKNNHIAKVYASEYVKAGVDYPIIFIKDPNTQELNSVLMWGIENGENLFMDGNNWAGGYLPASVRCFPFTMSPNPDDNSKLFIGLYENSPLINKEEGELIFNDDGSETEWMTNTKNFIVQVYESEVFTKRFLEKLDSLGILVAQTLSIQLPGTEEKKNIDGFFVIDRTKLNELSDEAFLELRKMNALDAIYAHLASLENIRKIMSKKEQLEASKS